jgi:hypothetical protein
MATPETAPHKATLRRSLQSALKHRSAANELLDGIVRAQMAMNAMMDKLDVDDTATLDEDYESTAAISDMFEADAPALPARHKATLRRTFTVALSHRSLANEVVDVMEEIQTAINATLVKLDAQGGELTDNDFAAMLAVSVTDADSELLPAQHRASVRRSLTVAFSHRRLARVIVDAIIEMQQNLNAALAQIDTGDIDGEMTQYKVTVIEPDQA